jgi:hypothetical protein
MPGIMALFRVSPAHFKVRRGDSPDYGLAGSGARMPKMWQMASVSLARLSV